MAPVERCLPYLWTEQHSKASSAYIPNSTGSIMNLHQLRSEAFPCRSLKGLKHYAALYHFLSHVHIRGGGFSQGLTDPGAHAFKCSGTGTKKNSRGIWSQEANVKGQCSEPTRLRVASGSFSKSR